MKEVKMILPGQAKGPIRGAIWYCIQMFPYTLAYHLFLIDEAIGKIRKRMKKFLGR